MGTKTLGSTANGSNAKSIFFDSSTGVAFKAHTNFQTATEDMYVDAVYAYCRPHNTSATLRHAVYKSNGTFMGQAPTSHSWSGSGGTTAEWTHSEWPSSGLLFLPTGIQYQGAVLVPTNAGLYTKTYDDGAQFDHWEGISSFPTAAGWTVKTWGSLPWYLTYFPKATVIGYADSTTSEPITHASPTDRIQIVGRSFTAGIVSIDFNGTPADLGGLNVFSDAGLNINVPVGATTGPVTVVTNAGTAIGPSLTIAGGRVFEGGALKPTVSFRQAKAGGGFNQIIRVRYFDGTALKDVH